jgi:hypothetical protein
MVLSVNAAEIEGFAATNEAVAEMISVAGSADSAAMLAAASAALGPIGAAYLGAYAPAQANNLAGTLLVAAAHRAISASAQAVKTSFVSTDNS